MAEAEAPQFSREELLQEAKRRGLVEGGFTREELAAEARRRGLIEGQPPQEEDGGGLAEAGSRATRAMISDINAGFQGVNPVSVSQATPLGVVVREGDQAYLDVDGTRTPIPQEDYGRYVTQIDPRTGMELLYERTPELEESGAASAGRILGYGLTSGAPGAARSTATAPARNQSQAAMRAMKDAGVTPSLGMTGPTGARVSGAMESLYPTAGVIARDAGRAMDEIGEVAEGAARSVGRGSSAFDGGTALIDGANQFLVRNLKGADGVTSKSAQLFGKVDQLIPPGTQINVSEVGQTLSRFLERFKDVPEIAESLKQGRWQRWLEAIERNDGALTWEQARALRTSVGESIGNMTGPMTDVAGGELKQVYGALTRDLTSAAQAAGPKAAKAWQDAVSHHRWASSMVDDALDIIFKRSDRPEGAFMSLLDLGKTEGRSASIKKLMNIKRAMPEEDWSTVVASVIRRMGNATPGGQDAAGEAFSASTFLTNWNRISPQAKSALFTGKGTPNGLKAEMDALAKMMEVAKAAERQVNVSRSGTVAGNLAMLSPVALGSTTTAFVTAVASHLSARALTSPPFLRAVRNYIARGGTKAAAKQLLNVANDNRALMADAANIIRLGVPGRLSGEPQAAPPKAAAAR